MDYVKFGVKGISPLLMHNPVGLSKPRETKAKVKTLPSAEDEAETATYRMPDGQLCLPSNHFRASLLAGSKNRRLGKYTLRSVLAGSVFVTDEFVPLYHPESGKPLTDYEVDIRRAVVQRQGVARARPKLLHWAGTLEFEYDEEMLTPDIITEALRIAGKIAGVGDYRPERTGPYGRYELEQL